MSTQSERIKVAAAMLERRDQLKKLYGPLYAETLAPWSQMLNRAISANSSTRPARVAIHLAQQIGEKTNSERAVSWVIAAWVEFCESPASAAGGPTR